MTEQRYTLGEITMAMGDALKALPAGELAKAERTVFLFTDLVVAKLKALKEKP